MALSRRSLLRAGAALGGIAAYGTAAHLLLQDDRWEPNDSYWAGKRSADPQARAQGRQHVDVAVVGGGFTGLSAAHHVKARFPELRVALYEARTLGFGASGRNGGLLVDRGAAFARRLIGSQELECELDGNQVDPYALVLALGALCQREGVLLFEDSQVRCVVPQKPALLVGDDFRVEADTVVLGTNAYTPRLGFLRRRLLPLHHGSIVTEPLGEEFDALPSDFVHRIRDGMDYYWGRTLPDRRLLFGGGVRYAYANGLAFPGARHLYAALERAMRTAFPVMRDARVTHRWNGPIAFFADSKPRIGTLGDDENVYYALGYAGNGVALALRFGHSIAEHLAGTALPAWASSPAPWLPSEPLRYALVNAGLHLVDFGIVKL